MRSMEVVGVEVQGTIQTDAQGCHIDVRLAAVLEDGRRVLEDPGLATRSISMVGPPLPTSSEFAESFAEGEDLGLCPLAAGLWQQEVNVEVEQLYALPVAYVLVEAS